MLKKLLKKISLLLPLILLYILFISPNHVFADYVDNIKIPYDGYVPPSGYIPPGVITPNFYQNGDISDMTMGRFSNTQYNISYPYGGPSENVMYSNFSLTLNNSAPQYSSIVDKNHNITSQSFSYNVGTPNVKAGAANRYIEFRVKASPDLEQDISSITIKPNYSSPTDPGPIIEHRYENLVGSTVGSWNPSLNSGGSFYDNDPNHGKVFISNSYLGFGFGGSADITIHLKTPEEGKKEGKMAKFMNENSKIYTYSASNTLYPAIDPNIDSSIKAYHPVYEALRIFTPKELNRNNNYNHQILEEEMKDPYIKKITDEYNKLIHDIPNKFPKPKFTQDQINDYINRITKERDDGINTITNEAHAMEKSGNYDNSIFNDFKNTANSTINKMKSETLDENLIQIKSVPDLDFGNRFIPDTDKKYNLIKPTEVSIRDVNYSTWNLNLSIGKLTSKDGNPLTASYTMNNTEYRTNESMPYYSYNNNSKDINDTINIRKYPYDKDNVRMNLPYSTLPGDYNGVATWNLSYTPVNSGDDSGGGSGGDSGGSSNDYQQGYEDGQTAGQSTGKADADSNSRNYNENGNGNQDYNQGYKDGYSKSYNDAYNAEKAYNQGYKDGQTHGHSDAQNNDPYNSKTDNTDPNYEQGYKNGYNQGYNSVNKSDNNSKLYKLGYRTGLDNGEEDAKGNRPYNDSAGYVPYQDYVNGFKAGYRKGYSMYSNSDGLSSVSSNGY
ncbi:hypothetical protein [Apilactobacillus micheneri]|uniref:hypothetical protein n=1 Tax=Apilactobacillus micheneri TaxID=1899430 RepID=UPI00112D81ED|nr:hypothetical protein [Apilactobacillus micheneri]TPR51637.1 hypothetical protein DY126_04270 [Apilactobacillus micheneri]